MLDINFVRQNQDQVKEACVNKNLDSSIVDHLLRVDEERRNLQKEMDNLRTEANINADAIKKLVAEGSLPDAKLVENGNSIIKSISKFSTTIFGLITNIQTASLEIIEVTSRVSFTVFILTREPSFKIVFFTLPGTHITSTH